jgi:hypothetical protein
MGKTSESHTTARRQLLARTDIEPPPAAPPPPRVVDPKQARRSAVLATRRRWIEQTTGIPLDEWFDRLDRAGAQSMSHHEIWKWLADAGYLSDGMLREGVTIAYEQRIGRREPGQSCEGDFPATATRVLSCTLDEALERWLHRVEGVIEFNGVEVQGQPKTSRTEKFRYWRAKLADGTQLNVSIYRQPDGRISLGVQHRPHSDRATADLWRAFWRAFVKEA